MGAGRARDVGAKRALMGTESSGEITHLAGQNLLKPLGLSEVTFLRLSWSLGAVRQKTCGLPVG